MSAPSITLSPRVTPAEGLAGTRPGTPVVTHPSGFTLPDDQRAVIRWSIYIGFMALSVGVLNGLDQALSYAGISILSWFPGMKTYYEGLTVHGVFNALVMTFSFTNGFLSLATARAFNRPLHGGLLKAALGCLVAGALSASWAMFTGRASVLYTFYPPLQAHPAFYIGLALIVVSTWVTTLNLALALRSWRREHRGERIPLMAYTAIATYGMWTLASIGIAIEVVGFLIPWSLGLLPGIDPLLMRTLFWLTGHPLVYFWLLPAYVSWYTMIPRMTGGRLMSDSLTRIVFVMFLTTSVPVGFHHQFTDPGISQGMKAVQAVFTFVVFVPSLATAFSIMASLENAGRNRGIKSLFGWIPALPWGDPAVSAQLLAMLTFVLGGITGLVNASYSMNQVIHNTTWVPGHFHMTVGSAVLLTFVGVAYWLVPYLTNRELWGRKLAVAQGWVYAIGVFIMARGLISGGLEGMPRRTFMAGATYRNPAWHLPGIYTGIGGTLMFIGALMFFIVLLGTIFFGARRTEQVDIPFTETVSGPATSGWELKLDNFPLWFAVAIVFIVIAYVPFFVHYLPPHLTSLPFTGY